QDGAGLQRAASGGDHPKPATTAYQGELVLLGRLEVDPLRSLRTEAHAERAGYVLRDPGRVRNGPEHHLDADATHVRVLRHPIKEARVGVNPCEADVGADLAAGTLEERFGLFTVGDRLTEASFEVVDGGEGGKGHRVTSSRTAGLVVP